MTHEDFDAFAAGRRVFDDLGLEPDVFEQSQPGLAWEDTHYLTVNDGAQIVALFQCQDELVVDFGVVRIGVPGPLHVPDSPISSVYPFVRGAWLEGLGHPVGYEHGDSTWLAVLVGSEQGCA